MSRASFTSILSVGIERFLAHKRAVGRRFHTEESALRLLDRYLVEQHVESIDQITPDLLSAFLLSRPRKRPRSYNHLLCVTRALFKWLVVQGDLKDCPMQAKPKRRSDERMPFIFDAASARRLLDIAGALPESAQIPFRGPTYRTIFALLYGLGLRVGEACRLLIRDVDLDRQLLIIRESKFYKSRLTPFGPEVGSLLQDYLQKRKKRSGGLSVDAPLFSLTAKGAIHPCTVSQTFHHLVTQLQLDLRPGTSSPRLHDLRHSFAVGTLSRWYRSGINPQERLVRLSTFLGHVDPSSTAVYLTISDALLQQANGRFELFAESVIRERDAQ
jgi:integrase